MALAAREISFGYEAAKPVLHGLTVSFAAGAVTAIIGPNGAGKSTLVRVMAGLLVPSRGSVALDGDLLAVMTHGERARRLGYLPQVSSLAFGFSVGQAVELGRYRAPRRAGAAEAALGLVGLRDRADEPLGHLSAGQQQRVALARVLAQLDLDRTGDTAARAILADEPASAMDPRHAMESMDLLRGAARRGLAVGIVLHDLTLAARWVDEAVLLGDEGRLLASGSAADVLSPSVLERGLGVPFRRLVDPTDGTVAVAPAGRPGAAGGARTVESER